MKKCLLFFLIICTSVVLSAKDITKTVKDGSFNSIDISSKYEVTLVKSHTNKVEISCDEDLMKYAKISIRNNVLHLDFKQMGLSRRIKNLFNDSDVKAIIYINNIESIKMSGATSLTSDDTFKVSYFKLSMSGASDIDNLILIADKIDMKCSGACDTYLNLNADEVNIDGSGACSIKIVGEAKDAELDVSGAVSVRAYNFIVDDFSAEISGASSARIFVNKKLAIDVSGASNLYYKTNNENLLLNIINVSRASSLKRK
ncbi:MAG: head GIN domain-containing protein [Bacteroidales bacterium]